MSRHVRKQDRDAANALQELYSGAGRYPVGGDESAGDNRGDEDEHAAVHSQKGSRQAPSEPISLRRSLHLST